MKVTIDDRWSCYEHRKARLQRISSGLQGL